jgi:hypothetical protein
MRAHTSLFSLLAVGALCATAAAPASAQQSAASGYARLAANAATAANAPRVIRPLAKYEFDSSLLGMPSRVMVADSAGTLVATFRARGTSIDQPMKVAIADRDILLEGETARGTLTIVLYDQNDPAVGSILGNWKLGSLQGELRARAVR